MTTQSTSPWLTRTEAAEYLKVSKPTLDRWTREGRIAAHRIEGLRTLRYRTEDLDAALVPDA